LAHQCLKCGRSYPDGSQEILKGCSECKGTRFFYTERPLAEGDREALAARAREDIDVESPAPRSRSIPTKEELPLGDSRDWISVGPNHLRAIVEDVVKRAHDKKPQFRVGGKDNAKSLAEWVREREREAPPADATASAALPPWPEVAPRRTAPMRAEAAEAPPASTASPDKVVYKRPRTLRPVALTGEAVAPIDDARLREEARKQEPVPLDDAPEGGEEISLYADGERPETVAVIEQGVYDLDVKRLLEKSPIVVHKDGTYSLHLPSLLESVARKKR
jgi:uncharacterized protein